jgi:murein L,D-transpeptidase YafK
VSLVRSLEAPPTNPGQFDRGFSFSGSGDYEYLTFQKNVLASNYSSLMLLNKGLISILFGFISIAMFGQQNTFLDKQLSYARVKSAWKDCHVELISLLKKHHLEEKKLQIFLRAFKKEDELEVWGKNSDSKKFVLLRTFKICAKSGSLGPKIQQGDGQVPEGVYTIDRFNPSSSYYLSLGISYPNKIDLARSAGKVPGGDIFIHGYCVTIGCLPMTNEKIEEIYLLAVMAKVAQQSNIPVHVFPFRMEKIQMELARKTKEGKSWADFWENLRQVYQYFEDNKTPGTWVKGEGNSYQRKG